MVQRMSKELRDIRNAIGVYVNKHKGNVVVHTSFTAFKGKNFKAVDDRMFCYGPKETLKIDLKG